MTRKTTPVICDFCAKEITSIMRYTCQFNQVDTEKSTKGQFVTCENKADMCHACFVEVCENGFKQNWVKKVKDENTGKWNTEEVEIQAFTARLD